jgi:hypothetical protein
VSGSSPKARKPSPITRYRRRGAIIYLQLALPGNRRILFIVTRGRYAVEELYDSRIQRIFRADDLKPIFLDQLLEDFRSRSQMVG